MNSMFGVSFVTILIAGIASVIIGWIWYMPSIFGSAWMRLSGITPEMMEARRRNWHAVMLVALLASMLSAYVMKYMLPVFVYPDWIGALELGFWCWLGFIAPAMLGMVLWEGKPIRLYLINSLYWLVSLIVMAAILVASENLFAAQAQMLDIEQPGAYLSE